MWRGILLNGLIVPLPGAVLIGSATGAPARRGLKPSSCRRFRACQARFCRISGWWPGAGALAFVFPMSLIRATAGLGIALLPGSSADGIAPRTTLAASARNIAGAAAMRVALPDANPSVYLTLSPGVTLPFNLIVSIPVYVATAIALTAP